MGAQSQTGLNLSRERPKIFPIPDGRLKPMNSYSLSLPQRRFSLGIKACIVSVVYEVVSTYQRPQWIQSVSHR